MNLQPLFDTPISEQTYIDRDYSGFGNDVWIVRARGERVVVRVSARLGAGGTFWRGLARLFDIDSLDMSSLTAISEVVNEIGVFRAPRVLRTGTIDGRGYVITELMPGCHIDSFDDLSDAVAQAFGRALARAHARTFAYCGSPAGRLTCPVAEFHERAAEVIEWLCHEYPPAGEHATAIAGECAANLRALAPPAEAAMILVDIGGSQYLWDDNGPTAVVDTEAFAFAPPALELIQIEFDNGARFAKALRRGYESESEFPDLTNVRVPYRCLLTILEVNGAVALDDAISAPVWF